MRLFPIAMLLAASASAAELKPLPMFPEAFPEFLKIVAPAVPRMSWTTAGEHGALLGRQDGTFESWIWPVKILSHFQISAEIENYPVPIDVNALAATVSVTPAETVITYSHAAFTIKQHAFAPRGVNEPGTGAVVFFEIQAIRPLTITFSFQPEMLHMWPAPNFGRPSAEWIKSGPTGFYILHTDNPEFSGIVAMPGTQPGILPPYQEHPQSYPLQLKLAFDPKANNGEVFPLLMATAINGTDPLAQVTGLNESIRKLRSDTQAYYATFFDSRTTLETPNWQMDEAMKWAEIAVDQMQVKSGNETGMVAGYYQSADSARPGYAWFFGRDTLWSTFAINNYGDFRLTRGALDFLIRNQRADGKIMHELSQSAAALDWSKTPYYYASADATPLLVMAMWDYVRSSGDVSYLKGHWDAVRKAYEFERAHDSDGDGIYENTEGTGWVESWPPGMPHQEIYLAALDQQSAEAISHLAALVQQPELAKAARATADKIGHTIEAEYLNKKDQFYAFSRNSDGTLDTTPSIYSAVAWWQGNYRLLQPAPMLSRWASPEFSTDWGTRDISGASPYFDPISYHQGSVWPLFTGWVSLAEYRAGRALSGYAHLMQNVRLTWLEDLGSTTELLSGEYYQPLGRSSSHQMWSSAMIVAPALRGLFGLQPDALHHSLALEPHLPADWGHARLHHVHVGSQSVDIEFLRQARVLKVRATTAAADRLCLTFHAQEGECREAPATVHTLSIPLPAVEISLPDDGPNEGDKTDALKVTDEVYAAHRASFTLSAPGGTRASLYVRRNNPKVRSEDFALNDDRMLVQFPAGPGYKNVVINFRW